jgi:hypothetical protein
MDVNTFIKNINDFSSRYKAWWYPAFEKFSEEYSKEHPKHDYTNYNKAFKEFETNLKMQNDLLGEIYNFIDDNYEAYLNATHQECEEIRKVVTNCYYVNNRGNFSRFFEDLFFRYAKERAIPKLQETGDKTWLIKGLVAISIENSGIDSRDSILALSDLRKTANKKGIDPEPEFERIAKISSNEKPRGGETPMQQLMAKIL